VIASGDDALAVVQLSSWNSDTDRNTVEASGDSAGAIVEDGSDNRVIASGDGCQIHLIGVDGVTQTC
jgi:hypothetical protein